VLRQLCGMLAAPRQEGDVRASRAGAPCQRCAGLRGRAPDSPLPHCSTLVYWICSSSLSHWMSSVRDSPIVCGG
jgi:hypothetical protein